MIFKNVPTQGQNRRALKKAEMIAGGRAHVKGVVLLKRRVSTF